MSRRSKRVTAAMLALLMVVSSSFSQVTTVYATELDVVTSQEAGTETAVATEVVAEEKETTTESKAVEDSQEVQTSTETKTESNTEEPSQEVQTGTEGASEGTSEDTTVENVLDGQTTTEVANDVAVLTNEGASQPAENTGDATVKTAREVVYFSEYIEGSSNNKALEIYNGTDATIDLSEYSIGYYTDGDAEKYKSYSFPEDTTIESKGIWVVRNDNAGAEQIKIVADFTTSERFMGFNGNDVICLFHGNTLIDTLGVMGGSNWAKNKTLVRKENVAVSSPEYNADEWTVYAEDTIKYLGARYGEYKAPEIPSEGESGTEDNQQQLELSTIADVKKNTEGKYKVTGIVTFVNGKSIYLQDATAGINAYLNKEDYGVCVGDTVTVVGSYKDYYGLVELDDATATIDLKGTEETDIPFKELTLAELKADYEATGSLESTRVYIKNVTLGEVNTDKNTTITDDENHSVNIFNIPTLTTVEEGDVVNVYAIVSDYNGLRLRVAAASEVEAVNPIGKVTIAEARATAKGTENVTVRGTVVFIDGKNVYIQDETAGIDLYDETLYGKVKLGDRLTVKGTRDEYNGLVELKNIEVLKQVTPTNATAKMPSKTVTIPELIQDYAGDNIYTATRVLVENVTLGEVKIDGSTTVTDADGNSIVIFKIPESKAKQGDKISFYALVSFYRDDVQLRVASGDDITVVEQAKPEVPEVPAYDPITDNMIPEGAVTVKDAAKLTSGTTTVVGQVVYGYSNNSVIIEDVIDNEVYGYLVYDYKNFTKYHIGDIVAVTGTATVYNGLPELKDVTNVDVIGTAETIAPQKVTMKELGADYLSEYVLIENVTLGEYVQNGSTTVTDATGSSVIYKAATFDNGIKAGSIVNLYAVCSCHYQNYQLRNNATSDYKVAGVVELDDSIELQVAKWAGTADVNDNTVVYGDLYQENDFLDTSAKLSLSTGDIPMFKNTNDGKTTYTIGKKGLSEGQYYLLEVNGSQYGNMELSFRMKGSDTAAKNFAVEYSVDGENFKAAGAGTLKCSYTAYPNKVPTPVEIDKKFENGAFSLQIGSKFHDISVKLPAEASNVETLYIRVRVVDNATIEDGKTIGNNATNYFNGIVITANPIISSDACRVVTTQDGEVALGQEITLETQTSGATIYYACDGATEYTAYDANNKPTFTSLPCTVTTYAAKEGIRDSLKITYHFTQAQVGIVKASLNGGAVALNSKVKLSCETENATIYYAFVENAEATNYEWQEYTEAILLKELPCNIAVKATKEGYVESAVKTLSFTQRENEKYNIYFGQLHAHTSYSDGAGTCEEAFKHASATENLDFLAVTDHSNSFDNADNANINDGSMSDEWKEGHELADKYTTEDFVGLYGFEMTWSNGLGHMNTFNSAGFQSRTQADYTNYATALQNYYDALKTAPDSISQFNHPGTTFGDFSDFAYYSEANDALITLVEVGNGEGAIGSSGYFPSYEYYTRALDKGWHVSPTNNQDNHKGLWGNANTARSVVLADSLTRENIYDAMRNYRVYATEDNDLNIYYTLDSYIMGTSLDKDLVGDKVEIKVELSDKTDEKIGKVEVIVNGGLSIINTTVADNEETVVFEVPSKYSYYYIKVTQADGDIAVTSPVWVGEVEAAGINGISTEESLPVTNEALDVTLGLYNNESEDMTINEITFSVDDTVVKKVDLAEAELTTVASETEATYTFSYTHKKVGAMEMDVTVKATLNGAEKVYNDVLKLTYVDSSMVSHVIIDGTHYNDYVAGYYGGNMGNFIDIAAEKNIKATIVTDKITDKTLENASILIVSAPAKKSDTANAGPYVISHYEDEFIQTVKKYVENGGTVIVCGIADYQDSTAGQTATETNKLLEAIGATIRMNSDEAYDEVNNGGQPYRLYYENINVESEHLAGFKAGQTYSAYSGCTVNIDSAAEETDAVFPAVALVKGFDTTYSIDCKTASGEFGDNAVVVEKGKVVALASQKTKFGGEIFVAGSVFMSDFEVKVEMDNYDTLPYANLTIINNILESKKVEIPATDIAVVRQGETGDVFAIEGYVANGTESKGTTFFDAIYVQDKTGGITAFPFAQAGVKAGTKIRIVGYVDEYQGDKEIQIVSYEILDDVNLVEIKPTQMSVKDSMDYDQFGGSYIQVTGTVSRMIADSNNKIVSEFWLTDGKGNEAAIFIDGYILSGTTGKPITTDTIKEGELVTAAGFLYKHPEGDKDESVPVLRVADCDDIKVETVKPVNPEPSKPENKEENTSNNTSSSNTNTSTPVKKEEPQKDTVVIEDVKTPLANVVGVVTVDMQMKGEKKVLQLELLAKYYENTTYRQNTVIRVYTSSNVGMTVVAGNVANKVTKEMNLTLEKKVLPSTPQHQVVFFEAEAASQYDFDFMMHMHVGKENAGKKAQIFVRTSKDATPVLVQEMTVNDIGNVAYQTQSVSDVIVLIAE